jgi:hypothetical protein
MKQGWLACHLAPVVAFFFSRSEAFQFIHCGVTCSHRCLASKACRPLLLQGGQSPLDSQFYFTVASGLVDLF